MERDDNESELFPSPESRAPQSPPVPITHPAADGVQTVAPNFERRRSKLPLVLFLLTCVSTFLVGGFGRGVWPHPYFIDLAMAIGWKKFLIDGLTYSVAVMAILSAHEMGHFLQAVRYGVPASFPYFIPMPLFPLGTMGAVIVQRAGVADRKSLFDIAISGPLAGLVVALPITWWGALQSRVVRLPENGGVTMFGDPLLMKWIVRYVHGTIPPGHDVIFNPLLFAGWVGIFITALNLIPIGQLDGGHILYTLLRQKAHAVARAIFLFAVVVVVLGGVFLGPEYSGWTLMLFLLWMMGVKHPPTANDDVPLGRFRTILGWLTLSFIVIGFTPTPIYESAPRPQGHPAAVLQAPPAGL